MVRIRFEAPVTQIGQRTILRLPEQASAELPSRGQVAVSGLINCHEFQAVLEPDGRFGHWLAINQALQQAANLTAGGAARLEVETTKEWPEPSVPRDLAEALAAAPQGVQDLWAEITPMARWEWVRWVNATRNQETRLKRIQVGISKLSRGKRRPCCFNLSACTDPDLARGGRLLEP